MKFIHFVFALLLVFLFTINVCAGNFDNNQDVQKYLKILKEHGYCYQSYGAILEVLVRDSLKERFNPEEYEITGGLELIGQDGFAIGEIDILVLRKSDNKVMLIGEAKIWKDLDKALEKASSQLVKLRDAIDNGKVAKLYYVPEPERKLDISIFDGKILYETFSSRGGVRYGFDYELPITTEQGSYIIGKLDRWHYDEMGFDKNEKLQGYLSWLKSNLQDKRVDEKKIMVALVQRAFDLEYPDFSMHFIQDMGFYDEKDNKLGHLSLVGINPHTGKVVLVAARPFGRNDLQSALKVSTEFMNIYNLAKTEGKIFSYKDRGGKTLPLEAFQGIFRQEILNIRGSKELGYTWELDLDYDEAHYLVLKLSRQL